MCARIFYSFLVALFVYLVATVAAFRYLDWWQALLVSAGTFVLLVTVGRLLVRHWIRVTITRVGETAAKGMLGMKSQVLRGATADVHAVRPVAPGSRPEAGPSPTNRRWYEVEATIYPDPSQAGPMPHWDLSDLLLVPADAPPWDPGRGPSGPAGQEFDLQDLVLVEDGRPVITVDGKVTGPRRVRFVVGVTPGVGEVQFRYYFEQFGRVRIPPALPGGPTF